VLSPHDQRIAGDKAVHAYVPALIQRYLGEEPLLGQPQTRWLGDASARRDVLGDLRPWVLKRREGVGGHEVRFGRELDGEERAAWVAAIGTDPEAFVAQRAVTPSTHVSLVGDREVRVRAVDLRLYALADDDRVDVLELGLTRRLGEHTGRSNLANAGTAIKDTWLEDASDA
jgi:carboxylate-amine ligase